MLEFIGDAYHFLSDVQAIVQWGGAFLVCVIIFVEKGRYAGFSLSGASPTESEVAFLMGSVRFE